MSQAVHLKFFNGARVALMEYRGSIEQVPTRYDLFQYDGGLNRGTKGSGSMALATAIAGWYAGHVACESGDHVVKWGEKLVRNLISKPDPDAEHVISPDRVKSALESETEL